MTLHSMTKHLFVCILVIVALYSHMNAQAAATYKWASLPFGGGGFVTGIITSEQEKNLIYARTDVGGAYRWIESSQSWKPINDNLSSDNCGLMGIESLAIDPSNTNRVYLYCGTEYFSSGKSCILRSDDYGDTWKTMSTVTGLFPAHGNSGCRQSGERLAVDPNDGDILLCGSRTKGLWKSKDGGVTWSRTGSTQFPDNQIISFVQYVASSGTKGQATPTIFVGIMKPGKPGTSNLYVSNDGGTTWTAVTGQSTTYMPHRCTLEGNTLYITYVNNSNLYSINKGAIYKYDISTGTWTNISPCSSSFGEVSVAKDNSSHLLATTLDQWSAQNWIPGVTTWGDQIYESTDGGKSWTNLMSTNISYSESDIDWMKSSAQLHWSGSVKIDPFNSNRAFIISGNGIFSTDNLWSATPTFHMAVKGLEETVPLDIVSMPGAPLAVCLGDVDGALYNDIDQYPHRYTATMGNNMGVAVASDNVQKMIRVGTNIYLTLNGGTSWKEISISGYSLPKNQYSGSLTPYSSCAISSKGNIIMVSPPDTKPYYSTDDGETWTMLNDADTGAKLVSDGSEDNVFYSIFNNALYVYDFDETSGTVTSSSKSIAEMNNVSHFCVVPGKSGDIWITRGSFGLAHLQNANQGANHITVTRVLLASVTCVSTGKGATDGSYPSLYIWGKPKSTDVVGIYRSDDAGATWLRINDDAHQFGGPGNAQMIVGDKNVYGRVYMSSVGRGVICGDLSNGSTEVESVQSSSKPFGIKISGNNVFLSQVGTACLYSIYSVSGLKIKGGIAAENMNISEGLTRGVYILNVSHRQEEETIKFVIK